MISNEIIVFNKLKIERTIWLTHQKKKIIFLELLKLLELFQLSNKTQISSFGFLGSKIALDNKSFD